jgi:Fe-Mn family superoxide dismutase
MTTRISPVHESDGANATMVNGTRLSRRRLLAGLVVAAGSTASRRLWAAEETTAPKETGLSSEGLLAGQPGFQPRTVAPLPQAELPGLLTQAQLTANHEVYRQAVDTLRATEAALATADRSPAAADAYRGLRQKQVASANDVLLHEFYFRGLAPKPVAIPSYVEHNMREHMGSVASWRADFTTCALAARSWAVLVYDPYDDRWHNAIMDTDLDGVLIGSNPLVVCDVAEHAWAKDYPRREEYVARFLDHLDWEEVARRYRRVDRM